MWTPKALVAVAVIFILMPPVPSPGRAEPWLSPVMGLSGGLIGGMTGSYAVPGVVYLQALGLPRDALVQTLGITFLVFTMALGTSLTLHGLMSTEIGIRSLAATLPALFGMALGEFLRHNCRRRPSGLCSSACCWFSGYGWRRAPCSGSDCGGDAY
jgi:uncharacterized protein